LKPVELPLRPHLELHMRLHTLFRFFVVLAFWAVALGGQTAVHARGELADYVAAPDSSYGWRLIHTGRFGSTDYAVLLLSSQTWRGIAWKHQLFILRPAKLKAASKQAFLYIHGGRWNPEFENGEFKLPREARIFTRLADNLGAPVAVLRQVPFQPLFERREDALIAYTFDQYLKTGEADWPLLLPMVKSAVRGMDAIQEFAQQQWQLPVEKFTVAGASKRGWTTWLTGTVDPRVVSLAPMVIDMLNFREQIGLQRATFGELSEEVQDYSKINLPDRIDSELGRKLIDIVDPYSYREQLLQPKLILLGTNDRYWPLDALKLYWNGLSEPKRVLYVPNQGHGIADINRLIGSLSALHRYSARGESLPRLSWSFTPAANGMSVSIEADRAPRRVTAWTAVSPTRDFRTARWQSHACKRIGKQQYRCETPMKPDQHTALYGEASFRDRGEADFSLSTSVCIAGGAESPQPAC
jgi:PhoPQ-activated pathogenicity-related protein